MSAETQRRVLEEITETVKSGGTLYPLSFEDACDLRQEELTDILDLVKNDARFVDHDTGEELTKRQVEDYIKRVGLLMIKRKNTLKKLECGCMETCHCTSWREIITEVMGCCDETWDDVVSCTLSKEELDKKFDAGFGDNEGKPFTLWTKKCVYFPTCYDGSEYVCSVSREPDGQPTEHVGG